MSEADRVFPRHEEQGTPAAADEKRTILSAPRRSGFGAGKSRVVEVVHIRRDRTAKPKEDRPHQATWNVRAETWPDGFRAKPAAPPPQHDMQPVAPEPAQPAVHVMPMWEPSPQQPVEPEAKPAEPPVETSAVERRKHCTSMPTTPKVKARHFADPFADGDSGANCIRCGYLVEQAREKRGLWTCSKCG